jgi:hypothetical protein
MRAWSLLTVGLLAAVGCGDDGGTAPPDRLVIEIPDAGEVIEPDAGELPQEECNTTLQDCEAPETPKCTVIIPAMTPETECLALTGTIAQDEVCMRTQEGNGGVGHDDCDVGLFCSGLGLPLGPPPVRRCRQFCDVNINCTSAGQRCVSLDGTGPLEGVCVPTCDLFSTSCDAVGAGMSCAITGNNDGTTALGMCRTNGAGAVGSACTLTTECGPNMNCLSNGQCAALCDSTHACPAGSTCATQPGLANMGGFCAPD